MRDLRRTKHWASFEGQTHSEEARRAIGAANVVDCSEGNNRWYGGAEGTLYASILCPAGFVREHRVFFGEMIDSLQRRRPRWYALDFAHVEGKINIELDGPSHWNSSEQDLQRDATLKALGWRVIRIKH
jgi:hypothetical protein